MSPATKLCRENLSSTMVIFKTDFSGEFSSCMDLQDYGGYSPSLQSLAMSWVAVTVGSTPELTPRSILTLKMVLFYTWGSSVK